MTKTQLNYLEAILKDKAYGHNSGVSEDDDFYYYINSVMCARMDKKVFTPEDYKGSKFSFEALKYVKTRFFENTEDTFKEYSIPDVKELRELKKIQKGTRKTYDFGNEKYMINIDYLIKGVVLTGNPTQVKVSNKLKAMLIEGNNGVTVMIMLVRKRTEANNE